MNAGHPDKKEKERDRERPSLFFWDYISLGLGQNRSDLKITNFPSFHRLWMGLHPRARLAGLYGPACPPTPPSNSVSKGGRVEC